MAGNPSGDQDDGSAPLFFLLALLICFVLPWTFSVLSGLLSPGRADVQQHYPSVAEDGSKVRQCTTATMTSKREAHIGELTSFKRMFTRGFIFRTVILLLLWCWLIYIFVTLRAVMATSTLYNDFNPYTLLDVSRYASKADIKKAFRKASLKYHPDKNPDPSAAEKFLMVKKAYDCLTDPIAASNYAKYGNPDGPTRVDIGMAIPSVGKEQQGLFLVVFLFGFILGVPLLMLACMGGGSESTVAPNGVLVDTMNMLAQRMTPTSDLRDMTVLLLACGESKGLAQEFREELERLNTEVKVKVPASEAQDFFGAHVLFMGHCQRRREQMSDRLRAELDRVLPKWRRVALAMGEIAQYHGSLSAHNEALELHRCIVQALVPSSSVSELLQVPHFDEEVVKQWRKGSHRVTTLQAFVTMAPDERKKALEAAGVEGQQLLDVEEFARCAPRLGSVKAAVRVQGETGICKDDIATLQVKFVRENLAEGEAAGEVHAPFFASVAVPEVWWMGLTAAGRGGKTRFTRISARSRAGESFAKFKVPAVGKNRFRVTLTCEGYRGLDVEEQVSFDATHPDHHNDGDDGADDDDLDD